MKTTKTKTLKFKVVDNRNEYWRTLGYVYVFKRKNRHYVIITNEEDDDDKEIYLVAPEYYHYLNTMMQFRDTTEINYDAFLSLILPSVDYIIWKMKLGHLLLQKLEINDIV